MKTLALILTLVAFAAVSSPAYAEEPTVPPTGCYKNVCWWPPTQAELEEPTEEAPEEGESETASIARVRKPVHHHKRHMKKGKR